MDLVKINGFVALDGAEPTSYRIVPLDAEFYGRGARFKSPTPAFLLGEATRFFNFGARPRKKGSPGAATSPREISPFRALIEKNFTPINRVSMEGAIASYGHASSALLYDHIEWVYKSLLGTSGMVPPVTAEHLLQPAVFRHPYIQRLLGDKCAASLLVTRLLCDNPDRPEYVEKPKYSDVQAVLQFELLRLIHHRTDRLLQLFHHESGIVSFAEALDRRISVAELWDRGRWVGSAGTLSHAGEADARVLARFASGAGEIGLAEKIYSTISLLANALPPAAIRKETQIWSDDAIWMTTRQMAKEYLAEIAVLTPGVDIDKRRNRYALEQWLYELEQLEDIVLFNLHHHHEVAGTQHGGYGPVRSDLVWGVLLTSYLRLFLLRACLLVQFGAIPFRLIFQGGTPAPYGGGPNTEKHREGIVGLIAVSLWEHLSGHWHPAVLANSAGNCLPWFATEDSKGTPGVRPADREFLIKLEHRRGMRDQYEIAFSDDPSLEEARDVYSSLELPKAMLGSDEKVSALRTLIANNYLILSPETDPRTVAAGGVPDVDLWGTVGKRKSRPRERQPLPFPPNGLFPLPLEQNPPFLETFFASRRGVAAPAPSVFKKLVAFCAPSLRSGCKISAQLQSYVASWLYWKLVQESDVLTRLRDVSCKAFEFDGRISLNDGSIQFGGRHPGHKSHRDGYGADWGIVGKATEKTWHWAVQWPQYEASPPTKNQTTLKSLTKKQTFAQLLWPADKPYIEWIGRVRGASSSLLQEARVLLRDADRLQQAAASKRRAPAGKASEESEAIAKKKIEEARDIELRVLKFLQDKKVDYQAVVGKRSIIDKYIAITENKRRDGKDTTPLDAKVLNIFPRTILIAQVFDEYNRRESNPAPKRRLIFAEYLTSEVRRVWEEVQVELQRPRPEDGSPDQQPAWIDVLQCEGFFQQREKELAGMPVFPDPGAHMVYHVAQLAVTLSLASEMLLGAPIYHLRAMGATVATLVEAGLPNPFSRHPANGFMEESKVWPLAVPILHCQPYDHHHHWHMQFWRGSSRGHMAYVTSCIPFWLMLGVDFAPFREYLRSYADLLRSRRMNSEEKEFVADITDLSARLDTLSKTFEARVRTKLFENAKASLTPEDLRKNMVSRMLNYEARRPAGLRVDCDACRIIPPEEWPPKNSALSRISKRTWQILEALAAQGLASSADADAWIRQSEEDDAARQVARERDPDLERDPGDIVFEDYANAEEVKPSGGESCR